MDESGRQTSGELQRIDGGRGGWRLPALLVAGVLIGVVVVARLGMEPDPPPTGLGPTLRPAATEDVHPTPQRAAETPRPTVAGPLRGEPVRLGPGPSQIWIGRYADGIPLRINDLPVRRVDEVVARQPSGSVFVAGWYVGPSCEAIGQDGYCPHGRIANSPADVANAVRSVRLAGAVPDGAGPAVFRATVEVACLPVCDVTVGVQEALWLGDALTDTGPIEVLPLLTALSDAFPGLTAAPAEERPDCPILPPAQAYRLTGAGVRAALVYPTRADREAAEGPVRVGQRVMLLEHGGQCRMPPLARVDATWIAQDNVLLLVGTARPLAAERVNTALADARARSRDDGPAEAAPISAWQALGTLWRGYPGVVLVPGAEEAFADEAMPATTWILRGADARVLAVFPDRRARRALDASALPRLVAVRDELDLRIRWVGIQNLLLGVSGGRDAAERVRELFRDGRR